MSEDLIGKLPKPVIVMDVDGVLLNWGSRFKEYCGIVGVDVSHIAERLQTTELFSLSKELGLNQEETLKLINGYAEHGLSHRSRRRRDQRGSRPSADLGRRHDPGLLFLPAITGKRAAEAV